MGGGQRQPYIYNPPARYSPWDPYGGFNPKAVSQASFAQSNSSRPNHDGPLMDFNRHPDSYLIPGYKRSENPMHPDTANWVGWAKKTQLIWRFLQIIAIIGMAVCAISIQGTTDAQSWIVRLPPFIDLVITLYAITYLFRSSKDLVPKSSAAYNAFAAIIDIGLIPFYVFICLLANSTFMKPAGSSGRWTTLFNSDQANNYVLQATILLAIVNASIHGLCIIIDLYLVVMYRKIAALPPDLNPLEDKYTRRKTKHKHKNSEIVHVTHDEKRMSEMSGTTEASSQRLSQASTASPGQSRGLAFLNSRADQNTTFSPHTPRSSKIAQQMYQHDNGARNDMHGQENIFIAGEEYAHRTSPMPSIPMSPKRGSVVSSLHSHELQSEVGEQDYNHHSREEMQSDNWFVVNESNPMISSAAPSESSRRKHQHTGSKSSNHLQPAQSQHISPLRMNPPTPPPQPISARVATNPMPFQYEDDDDSERSKTMTSAVSAMTASSQYSTASEFTSHAPTTAHSNESWGNSTNAPKGKYFGDLSSAMRGLRPASQVQAHQHQYHEVAASSPSRTARVDIVSPRPKSMVGSVHYAESEISSWNGSGASSNGRHGQHHQMGSLSGTIIRKNGRDDRHGRVVSRSGVDVDGDDGDMGLHAGGMRGRDVSGKVAEEGRGGAWGAWIRRGG